MVSGLLAALSPAAVPMAQAQLAPGLPEVLPAPADEVRAGPAWRDRLVRLFREGVLRHEDKREHAVLKWARPIDLTLRGAIGPYAGFVRDLAAELTALTGLVITVSTDQDRGGGIDVYVSPAPGYWPASAVRVAVPAGQVFTCAAAPSSAGGVIRRSAIRINAGVLPPATVRACLVEEIVQSLGLMGEVAEPDETILYDRVGYEGLGIVDRLLLKALYDPRLEPGMSAAAAAALVGGIFEEQLGHLDCREAIPTTPRRCRLR